MHDTIMLDTTRTVLSLFIGPAAPSRASSCCQARLYACDSLYSARMLLQSALQAYTPL